MAPPVLSGVRVVELATMAAAPGACAVLADFGAEVIKVEPPGGDPWRRVTGGVQFTHDNRGKRSVLLDVQTVAGMAAFKRLLGTADCLVTNVRTHALEKLGLSYEALRVAFPRLVVAQLSAWGRVGPMAMAPGYDAGAFWAATGLMELLRPDDEGALPRLPGGAGDHATSMQLVAGIALALFHQQRTGEGQLVDASLFRSGLWCNAVMLVAASADKAQAEAWRMPRETAFRGHTFKTYACKDGVHLHMLGYQTKRHLPAFYEAIGLAELAARDQRFHAIYGDDPRRTTAEWEALAAHVTSTIDARFRERTAREWEQIFDAKGVWYTRVARYDDLLPSGKEPDVGAMSRCAEQAAFDGSLVQLPQAGQAVVAAPIRLSCSAEHGPRLEGAPALGADTEDVLRAAGLSEGELAALRAAAAAPAPARRGDVVSKARSKL